MPRVTTVRIITAVAVLVSAYVHLYEWLNGFRDRFLSAFGSRPAGP